MIGMSLVTQEAMNDWNDSKYDRCSSLGGILLICHGFICNTCERCESHCNCMFSINGNKRVIYDKELL